MDKNIIERVIEYLRLQAENKQKLTGEEELIDVLKESDDIATIVKELSSPDFAYELGPYKISRLRHMDWVNNELNSRVADRDGVYIGTAYIVGYKEAVDILSMSDSSDTLIYPIMFSAMQYVELALKRCLAHSIELDNQDKYAEQSSSGESPMNLCELFATAIFGSQQAKEDWHDIKKLWKALKENTKIITRYGWDNKDVELIESIINNVFKLNEHMGWRYWKELPRRGGKPYLDTKDMVIDGGVISMFINILDEYFAEIYDLPMSYTEEDLKEWDIPC